MLKESITAEDVCNLLNNMLEIDYDCVHELISHRVKCNELLANHPTIQVQKFKDDAYPKVGLLGILNGFFGIRDDGFGSICMEIDSGRIIRFKPTPEST